MKKLFVSFLRRNSLWLPMFFAVAVFCGNGNAFASDFFVDKAFFELPFFMEAENARKMDMLSLSGYEFYYLPKPYFSGTAETCGTFEGGFDSSSGIPSLSFYQNLPGLVSLSYGIKSQMSVNEEYDFSYTLNPSFSLQCPLFAGVKLASIHLSYGRNNYRYRKRNADLNYRIKLNSNTQKYVMEAGNYLYYKKMVLLYQEKSELLQQRIKDYEQLFAMGKANGLDVSEKVSDHLNFLREKVEVQGKLIEAGKNLSELGVNVESLNENLDFFVGKWKKQFQTYFSEAFMQNEQEMLQVDISHFQNFENYISQLPTVSSGFSVLSPSSQWDFPDFSAGKWSFNLSFNIPLYRNFSVKAGEFLVKNKEMAEREKAKIRRKQENTKKERENYVSIYESYKKAMEKSALLEENRLASYEELNKMGRLSNFDLKMQQNTTELSRLYAVYADLQLLVTKASFF